MKQYAGIDAGASWIKAGLFDEKLTPLKTVRRPSGAREGATVYFANIVAAAQELSSELTAIGLALPAQLSVDSQYIDYMVNVAGLEAGKGGIALAEAFNNALAAPYIAHNDASCAALGEWVKGRGQADPSARLLHLTWGTGIGTGFVSGGQPQYGWEGGHIPLVWEKIHDEQCNCGSYFDLESFIAVPFLIKKAQRLRTTGQLKTTLTDSVLNDSSQATQALLRAAQENDALASAVLNEALMWMARGLHIMAVTAQPSLVTVGGGLMANDWLLEKLREKVQQEAHGLLATTLLPEHVFRAQRGNEAGMIGAALLAQSLNK